MIDWPAWLGVVLSLSGNYLVIRKSVWGWVVWGLADVVWLIYNLYKGLHAQAFLFTVYTIICIYGVYKWNKRS